MANNICFFNKESLVIKAPKRSPLAWRLVVLAFAMVCGVYICSICLKQIDLHATAILNFQVFNQQCNASDIEPSELHFVHYPKPVTFSRSGSGWFETLFNSHINVSFNGEIFGKKDRRANVSVIVNKLDKIYNLDWFTSTSKNECDAAIGFKWMFNQGVMEHHKGIVEYFNEKGVHAIFLFRRNLLRRMISVLANAYDNSNKPLNGTHKSHVHSSAEAKVLPKYKPTINTSTLISELKHVDDRAAKAIGCFKSTRHIVVYYEDVVGNQTKLKEVQKFLRLPYRELTSRQVKIHTGDLSNQIQNWDEVQKILNGTSYQSFLRSDYQM